MRDIVDRIDELVDEQMRDGEPRVGYDYGDPQYPRCPHCRRHWHGLRITKRIASMYDWGRYDENYSSQDDDSPVLCEGSEFIGPQRGPTPPQWSVEIGGGWQSVGTVALDMIPVLSDWGPIERAMRSMQAMLDQMTMTLFNAASWQIIDSTSWFTSAEAAPCSRDVDDDLVVELGPQQWIHEMLSPAMQFPRTYRTPLESDVSKLWDEFTAPTHPLPERRPIDFEALEDGMSAFANTGPALPPLRTRGHR